MQSFLLERSTAPVLFQYTQDTTKIRRTERVKVKGLTTSSFLGRRSTQVCGDFIVQALFLCRSDGLGGLAQQVVFRPPTQVAHGETSLALAAI
eukprot:4698139-Amphidinium_carterae.1